MEQAEKDAVEGILRRLLRGTQVVGAHWYPFAFAVFFARLTASDHQGAGAVGAASVRPSQVTITIESRWAVYPVAPDQLPAFEEDLPRCGLDQQVAALARLAGKDIVSVVLGDERPHLALGFEGGPLLFIHGHHDAFECWNLTTGEPAFISGSSSPHRVTTSPSLPQRMTCRYAALRQNAGHLLWRFVRRS